MKHDLTVSQLSKQKKFFLIGIELFNNKWKKYEEFLKYLNKQWIVAHYGWFEGFKDSQLPSTNNSLPLDPVLRAIYVHGTNEHLIKINELVNLKTNKEIGS